MPANILNLTGAEILSVREIAESFGRAFSIEPVFKGVEQPTAFLSNASRIHELLGPPRVATEEVLELVAHWVESGGATHGKPTKFEVRDGHY